MKSASMNRFTLTLLAVLALPSLQAQAADAHAGHQVSAVQMRSEHTILLPAVALQRNDGKRMTLAEALDDGRPVMLNFIFTSCNAICPVSSQIFVEFRERIGPTRDKLNMVSFSIDPEQDTPAKLTEYAARFGSAGTWSHYTSSVAGAVDIQRAFGVWRGDKMNHQPVTFLRAAPGKPWVRLDGFVGPTALVDEVRKSMLAQAPDGCRESDKAGVTGHSTNAGAKAGINVRCRS
jgi:protein SCO1/2